MYMFVPQVYKCLKWWESIALIMMNIWLLGSILHHIFFNISVIYGNSNSLYFQNSFQCPTVFSQLETYEMGDFNITKMDDQTNCSSCCPSFHFSGDFFHYCGNTVFWSAPNKQKTSSLYWKQQGAGPCSSLWHCHWLRK